MHKFEDKHLIQRAALVEIYDTYFSMLFNYPKNTAIVKKDTLQRLNCTYVIFCYIYIIEKDRHGNFQQWQISFLDDQRDESDEPQKFPLKYT